MMAALSQSTSEWDNCSVEWEDLVKPLAYEVGTSPKPRNEIQQAKVQMNSLDHMTLHQARGTFKTCNDTME